MSEEVKTVDAESVVETKVVATEQQIKDVLDRIEELNKARGAVETKQGVVDGHLQDLATIETVKGANSEEFATKKTLAEFAQKELEDAAAKVKELTFKRSELKLVLDTLVEQFQEELRKDREQEYHIEVGTELVKDGKKTVRTGVKAYNQLLDYLYHAVNWTAKTAVGLMVLVRNMEENRAWVRSADFDGVIILRSANVLVLYRSILEDMTGRGYETAKGFLECWTNCGVGITNAVKEINKRHDATRVIGANLNTVEEEYGRAVNDLPEEETTATEVAPEA